MEPRSPSAFVPLLCVIVVLISIPVRSHIILEEGYTVTTIIDGYKLGVNPRSVVSRYGSPDLIILDSSGSSLYTLSFSNAPEGAIQRLSGNGAGYVDGDLGSALFNNPRSFVLDLKNNVYVADPKSHAIRKLSKSGVTTIAGGYTQKAGKADGPGQNASFSDDFELAFIPQRCSLMIADHGNKLIREIALNTEDCASSSESTLGATSIWVLSLGGACLLGMIIGFAVRPYVASHGGYKTHPHTRTWKFCLTCLGKQATMLCFDFRNAIVSSRLYQVSRRFATLILSHLSLMFGLNLLQSSKMDPEPPPVSLLDCDDLISFEITKRGILFNQSDGLVCLEDSVEALGYGSVSSEQAGVSSTRKGGALFDVGHGKINRLIEANFMGFAEQE